MDAGTYNGWSNYETWAVAVWFDNEESLYRHVRDLTRTVWREAPLSQAVKVWGWSRQEAAECRLAELMQEFIEDGNAAPANTLYADLMCAALGNVNWHEIARSYIADMLDEEDRKGDAEDGNDRPKKTSD